jgi:serine/threonine protein phosphatase PrpC
VEDCHVVHAPGTWGASDPGLAFLGVYDGHGGRGMVDYLEYFFAYHVAQELNHNDDAPIATRLERAFVIADIHGKQCGVSPYCGATVLVCLVKKIPGTNRILIHTANAGDARAVLGHQGKATRLSHDHRVEGEEITRIKNAGGVVWNGRVYTCLAVARSLGDYWAKELVIAKPNYTETVIDLSNFATPDAQSDESPTMLILGCDGLWDVVQDQEAVDFALNYDGEKSQVARHLVETAIARGSADNVTVVVAWL